MDTAKSFGKKLGMGVVVVIGAFVVIKGVAYLIDMVAPGKGELARNLVRA